MRVLVMGVAGSGKSTLAAALSQALGWPLVEADDFHDDAARAAMAAGRGLGDAERAPWLGRVAAACAAVPDCVLACSALKQRYRQVLAPDFTVMLALDEATARQRLAARSGHFVGPALASSQFADLEPPAPQEAATILDATASEAELLELALAAVATVQTGSASLHD